MPFDLTTAVPIEKTENNELRTRQFDLATARPIPGLPKLPTAYENYLKTEMDEQIRAAVLQPLTVEDLLDIAKGEREEIGALWAGVIPYVKGTAGFFTRPFGVEPFGDTYSPEQLEETRGKHPVATTIGEIIGGVAPYIITAPFFPQTLIGMVGTFGSVAGVRELGRQQVEESIMTPPEERMKDMAKEVGKAGLFAPIWYYSRALQFIGRPYASALTRAGTRGVGSATLSKVFGADLETAFREGGLITALSLIFEAPFLAKTALGRGIIKQVNRVAKEAGLPEGRVDINVDALDFASKRQSIFRLVRALTKLMKMKGKLKAQKVTQASPQQKFLEVKKPIDIAPKGPPAKVDLTPKTPEIPARPVGTPEFGAKPPTAEAIPPESIPIPTPVIEEYRAIVEKGGGEWVGIQKIPDKPDYVMFNDPETKTTLMLPAEGLTPEKVRAKIAKAKRPPGALPEGLEPPPKKAPPTKKILGEEPSEFVRLRETTLLKMRIQNIARGARMGAIATKQQIGAAQGKLTEIIKESGLEAKDKAKFLATIKGVQTREQLEKALPAIEERIVGLAETAQKRALIAGIKEKVSPAKLKKMRPEFAAKIRPISETFLAEKPTEKTLKGLRSTVEFVKAHPDNQIPQKRLNELGKLEKIPLRDLSVEQLQQISDTIAHAIKLNELKNRLIIKGKLREFKEIKKQAIHNMNRKTEKLNGSLEGLDSFQQEKEAPLWKKIFGADSYNAELKCEILDGEDGGVIMQVLFNEFDDGVAETFKFLHGAEDFFKDKLKGIDIGNWSRIFQAKPEKVKKVTIEISGGRKLTMTKGERIAFALHARNPNNTRHIVTGGFAFAATPSKIIKLTQADLDRIAGSLTPEELKVADTMYEHFNTKQKDAINEVSVDINGHEIAVEPDYFPIRTNYLDRFKEELIKTGNYSQKTLEGLGIFKERQAATNAIILEDAFLAVYKSMKSVSAYIGFAKPLRGAKTLLNDNDFQIAARSAGYKHYVDSLKSYLARLEGESIRLDNVDRLTQELINKLDVSILGLNPWVMFKQPISFLAAATEMDTKYLKKGFAIRTTQKDIDEMMKWCPHLRDRLEGHVTRELGEIAEVGRPRRFFTGKEVISQKFMKGIRNFDMKAIGGIWRAAKFEIAKKKPGLKGDEFFKAVAKRAWKAIRRTQPTFHIKDRSTIGMSRNVFVRLLTKYSSQRNKNWMMIRRAFEKYNRSDKSPRDKARLAKALAIISFISPLLLLMTDELRDVVYKRKQKESLFRRTIERFLTYNFGIIYFLGIGFNSLVSKIDKGTFAGYDINDPVTSTMDELIDSLANLVRSVEQAISQEKFKAGKKRGELKWKDSLKKFAIGALDITGRVKGIPVETVRRLLTAPFRKREKGKKKWK